MKVLQIDSSISGSQSVSRQLTASIAARLKETTPYFELTYRDLVQRSDGAAVGALALMVTNDAAAQRELDPFVAARVERSRTAQTLTEANLLFENGRVAEARDKLAAQSKELAKSEVSANAFARARPVAAAPRNSRPFDDDFKEQRAAVAQAEANFAPPPPAKGGFGGFGSGGAQPGSPVAGATAAAPAQQDTREGKAARKTNQSNASDFGF